MAYRLRTTVNGDAFNNTFNKPSQTMIGTITSIYDRESPARKPARKSKAWLTGSSGSIPRRSSDILLWRETRPTANSRHRSLHHDPRRLTASYSIRPRAHHRC